MAAPRLYLSPPHMDGRELTLLQEAFASNWIAPLGPQVDAFDERFEPRPECGPNIYRRRSSPG